jgi:hypothetical protein
MGVTHNRVQIHLLCAASEQGRDSERYSGTESERERERENEQHVNVGSMSQRVSKKRTVNGSLPVSLVHIMTIRATQKKRISWPGPHVRSATEGALSHRPFSERAEPNGQSVTNRFRAPGPDRTSESPVCRLASQRWRLERCPTRTCETQRNSKHRQTAHPHYLCSRATQSSSRGQVRSGASKAIPGTHQVSSTSSSWRRLILSADTLKRSAACARV